MWPPSLWFHSRLNQNLFEMHFCSELQWTLWTTVLSNCFGGFRLELNWKSLLYFSFSSCRYGTWVVHLELYKTDFEMEKKQQYGDKRKMIFSLVYIFYGPIKSWNPYEWMCERIVRVFFLSRMKWLHSLQLKWWWWEALPKVIHHARDDAEPAICVTVAPPVEWAHNMLCVIYSIH